MVVDKILGGLNREQIEAVTHREGPLLIIAGAGTGKTSVITHRIAYLIDRKLAHPEEILALTFTDKAAEEMEERVDVLLPYGYANVWVGTFHAFGKEVLEEKALEIGLSPDFQVLTEAEQIIFFREHLFQFPLHYYRPLGNPTRYIREILKLISRAKDEDVSPEEYLEYAQTLQKRADEEPSSAELRDESQRQMELALTYQKYQELLFQEGKVDFGDLVTLPLQLFRQRPSILAEYRGRYKFILVDEFQDTNHAQFELVRLLSSKSGNITVVGDDDQAIYKFRGAALSNIMGFMDAFPGARKIVLKENFRSPQPILDVATRLISFNNPDRLEVKEKVDKRLISRVERKSKGPFYYHFHRDTLSSEADTVANLIEEKVKKGERRYSDFAILVRSNNDADPFLRSLNMKGIPWRFSGNRGLYQREEVRSLISFLRVLADPYDNVSLHHLASSPFYRFPPYDLQILSNFSHRNNRPLFYLFTHLEEMPLREEINEEGKATVRKMVEDVNKYLQISQSHSTGEVLYAFLRESGYLNMLLSQPSLENEEKVRNIARFFEIVRSSSQVLSHDRVTNFCEYLDLLREAGDNPSVAEAEPDVDAVNVLTVHKAKGLEFPVVFMVGLVMDRFPTRRKSELLSLPEELVKSKEAWFPEGDIHLQEERRLFYVGITRAKEELYFTSAEDYGGRRKRKISRFVVEALNLPTPALSAPRTSALEVIERSAPLPRRGGERKKREGEILNLSYYQIDDYNTCPLKYKYVHILRLRLREHHAVVYGKALHDAVQEYYRRKLAGIPVKERDVIKIFESSWSSEGFLSREHEERRFEEGKKVLHRFFREEERKNILPTHTEKEFSFLMDNDIRIIGRWDRIDQRGGEIVIIDYKTSEIREEKKANERTRSSLQMRIYALAYKNIYGIIPDRVELHFLDYGLVGRAKPTERWFSYVRDKIVEVAEGIKKGDFTPRPGYTACGYCAYQQVCPATAWRGED